MAVWCNEFDEEEQTSKHGRFCNFTPPLLPSIQSSGSIKNHGLAACTCTSVFAIPFSSPQLLPFPFPLGMEQVKDGTKNGAEMLCASLSRAEFFHHRFGGWDGMGLGVGGWNGMRGLRKVVE